MRNEGWAYVELMFWSSDFLNTIDRIFIRYKFSYQTAEISERTFVKLTKFLELQKFSIKLLSTSIFARRDGIRLNCRRLALNSGVSTGFSAVRWITWSDFSRFSFCFRFSRCLRRHECFDSRNRRSRSTGMEIELIADHVSRLARGETWFADGESVSRTRACETRELASSSQFLFPSKCPKSR